MIGTGSPFSDTQVEKWNGIIFQGVQTLIKQEWHAEMFLKGWGLLIFFFLPVNKGIYEAINEDFLDSYNLSLLNPYMVGDLLFSCFVVTSCHGCLKSKYIFMHCSPT